MTVSGGPAGEPGAAGPDTRHLQAIAAVTALTAALVAPLAGAWAALTGTLDRLTAGWPGEPASVRVRRARGFAAQAAVLLTPLDEAVAADADDAVARVFNAASAAAAVDTGTGWVASRADRRVLDHAAADLTADLRTAIAYTLTTARSLARQVERLADADGPVAEQAGALERALADRGLAAVVYRDGSRHALDEYARMATRTKLAQTWQIAGLRLMSSAGVTYAEVADGPSCGWTSHTDPDKADGKIVTVDEALAYPLAHPRCVMPDTRAAFAGGLLQIVRGWYVGPSYTFTWATPVGTHRTTVGPHHPVLTRRGWVQAHLLREGDELLHHRDVPSPATGHGVSESDLEDVPPHIEEVFEASCAVRGLVRVAASGDDLHGDGRFCEGEVEVVDADGGLLPVPHASLVEHPREREFVRSDAGGSNLTGDRSLLPDGVGVGLPAPSLVGGGETLAALLWRHASPVVSQGLGLPADEAELAEAEAQRNPGRHPVHSGDLVAGQLLIDVEPDQLIRRDDHLGHRFLPARVSSVHVGWHEGWVYDASTVGGWFTADCAIVSNCIRTTYPRTDVRSPDEAQVAPRLGRGGLLADDGGTAPAVRDGSGLLDVRSPVVLSPAAGRHAASVTRALARAVPVAGVVRASLKQRTTPVSGPGQP